jgi:hypothetical protein
MTVKRQGEANFSSNKARLAACTRTILAGNPIYKDTLENGDGSFSTRVKPSFYLASTAMTISFEEAGAGTTVKVETTSQAFIIGDKWGYYIRYINDFLGALKQALH